MHYWKENLLNKKIQPYSKFLQNWIVKWNPDLFCEIQARNGVIDKKVEIKERCLLKWKPVSWWLLNCWIVKSLGNYFTNVWRVKKWKANSVLMRFSNEKCQMLAVSLIDVSHDEVLSKVSLFKQNIKTAINGQPHIETSSGLGCPHTLHWAQMGQLFTRSRCVWQSGRHNAHTYPQHAILGSKGDVRLETRLLSSKHCSDLRRSLRAIKSCTAAH